MAFDYRASYRTRTRPRRPLFVVWAIVLAISFILGLGAPAQAEEPAPVRVLELRGVVDPIVAQYIQRGIEVAGREGAGLVVIQMDTPGGLDTAMRSIVQAILNSDTPVVVFVAPRGARAASAGVFITMAAHVAAMAPGTNIGAATPVDMSQEEMSDTLRAKVVNDAAAYVAAIAQQRGRNAAWAEEAVREAASLTAQQALDQQVVELIATDLDDLLAQIDGREVAFNGRTLTLRTESAPVEPYKMTWLEVIVHGLIDPNIAYLLLSLGTLALVAEFYNPGSILPGVTGVIALILGFVALGSLPVNWGGIALIVLAIIFFVADTQVAGFALSMAGAISFVLGSLLLFSPFSPGMPGMPQVAVNPWLIGAMTALLVGFFGFAVTVGLRSHRGAAMMGTHALLGKTGTAVTELAPQGIIQVGSESWSAIATDGPVQADEQVEVVGQEGLRLQVRRRI